MQRQANYVCKCVAIDLNILKPLALFLATSHASRYTSTLANFHDLLLTVGMLVPKYGYENPHVSVNGGEAYRFSSEKLRI